MDRSSLRCSMGTFAYGVGRCMYTIRVLKRLLIKIDGRLCMLVYINPPAIYSCGGCHRCSFYASTACHAHVLSSICCRPSAASATATQLHAPAAAARNGLILMLLWAVRTSSKSTWKTECLHRSGCHRSLDLHGPHTRRVSRYVSREAVVTAALLEKNMWCARNWQIKPLSIFINS
jgi:hypothetical protein